MFSHPLPSYRNRKQDLAGFTDYFTASRSVLTRHLLKLLFLNPVCNLLSSSSRHLGKL